VISPDIHVMLSPARAYAAYAPAHIRDGVWIAIRRPLLVMLIQGVAIAMTATRTVAAPVVLSVAVCWSAALLVQFVAAGSLITSRPNRTVSTTRAIDLLFLGHAPWSLWILAAAGVLTWGPTSSGLPWIVILTMVVPAAITTRIVYAFARHVLGMDHRTAWRRAALHQAIVWTLFILFISTAVALWPRILGALTR
jgi:hypothetical protein